MFLPLIRLLPFPFLITDSLPAGRQGCFLILSREFVYSLTPHYNLSEKSNDDAYLFFSAIEGGYRPRYIPSLKVYYKSPTSFRDHLSQSSRFQFSKEELERIFLRNLDKEYLIPKKIFFLSTLKYFIINPLLFTGYILIYLMAKIKRIRQVNNKWKIALSTK